MHEGVHKGIGGVGTDTVARGEYPHFDGEDPDHQNAHQELRNRLPQHRQHTADIVNDTVLPDGADNADPNADNGAEQHGVDGQLQGVGQTGDNDAGNVLALVGQAQVAVEDVAQPVKILDDQGFVQAQLLPQLFHNLGRL